MQKSIRAAAAITMLFMMATATPVLAQSAATHAEPFDVSRMNETMDRIRSVEDPEQRAQLLEQHLDEMHAAMGQIHRAMGQLMEHVEEQRKQQRRLHDHRRMK